MTTESSTPWGQTTTGIIVVNGVITAVVSALATWAINNAAPLPWASIAVTFALVAIGVFLALSLFQTRLRETFWTRPFQWVRGLRVTTTNQRGKAILEAENKALAVAQSSAQTLIATSESAAADAWRKHETLAEENVGLTLRLSQQSDQIRALESTTPSVDTTLPRPDPRWRVYAEDGSADGTDFTITNSVPRSVAREVRIEPDDDMEILDAGHWEDLSGSARGSFRAAVTDQGWEYGVRTRVAWYDEKNTSRVAIVRLTGAEPNTVIFI